MGDSGYVILVSNDDGVRSEGITALSDALKELGTVYVVAPDRERSAASHSLSLTHPLRVEKVSPRVYSVDGTPTDCVNLGVNGILRGKKIDLLVSGINKGANLGDDITYSGTVSAAMEGTLQGIPSIAVSLVTRTRFRFDTAAAMAVDVARKVLEAGPARRHPPERKRAQRRARGDQGGAGHADGEAGVRRHDRREASTRGGRNITGSAETI